MDLGGELELRAVFVTKTGHQKIPTPNMQLLEASEF
jgi:hypothetical protein